MVVALAPPTYLPPAKPDHASTARPDSPFAEFLWRRRLWFESTFALSMLEPWEKILLLTIFAALFILVASGIIMYFPQHLAVMQRRAIYYLWGQEGSERTVWQWLGLGGTLHKEL
ncbi:hypothetical protein R3P38DRAFT_3172617 [Favolaschia claudopus]|uniref:Uncharacterized protein n=1 Tax=Favolaschia claudopus TaxID=2862362 RepID=A0AAW0DMI0_9AGAR